MTLVLVVAVGAGAVTILMRQTKRLAQESAQRQAEAQQLLRQGQGLKDQIQSLEGERKKLQEALVALTADRDNLATQTKRLADEELESSSALKLHEQVLKRTGEENRSLKGQIEPLETAHNQLEREYEGLLKEQARLRQDLEQARQRTEEQKLKEALAMAKAKNEQSAFELREAQRTLKDLQSRQARTKSDLTSVQERLTGLEQRYTGLISQNKTLQYQVAHVPNDVTGLAREHEQLVKEMADTHYNMGLVYVEKDDYVRASKEFEKTLELRPDDGDALYNLGLIYAEHLPDRERATACFRRYLQLNPQARDASWVKQYIASWHALEAKERLE